jgi:hypothetical protein
MTTNQQNPAAGTLPAAPADRPRSYLRDTTAPALRVEERGLQLLNPRAYEP